MQTELSVGPICTVISKFRRLIVNLQRLAYCQMQISHSHMWRLTCYIRIGRI